jgi:chromatin structure-remodeling complex subunit RSC9
MFSSSNDGELTQVEFFSLYRDTFTGVGDDAHPLMAAADLIKAVPRVFPNASATVVPGPPTRFVVRGIERRKEERLLCRWGRGACDASPFDAPSHLVAHVLVHAQAQGHGPCEWATCAHPGGPHLATHVRTHLPIELPPDTASLGGARIVMRAPAVRDRAGGHDAATIKYPKPVADAPSATLAALLCIRVLFHHAYAVVERAPRADEDRFGFPGVVEDDDAEEVTAVQDAAEREGAQRGQRAFARIRGMLENVVLKEDVLMGWIAEILDAGDTDDLQI